jgi:surface antigen
MDTIGDSWNELNRECVSFVAWRLSDRNNYSVTGYGSAINWKQEALNNHIPVDNTPAVGAVAWFSYGHVAYVDAVNGSNVDLEEYNYDYAGDWHQRLNFAASSVTNFIHFNDTPQFSNTVLQVKKITDSDGTNEVIWAKATDVFDSLWKGSSIVSVNRLISISQSDIKSIDVNLYSNGEHDVFVATAHNIWEIWWYQGQGPNVSNILPNIGNISKIIKAVGPDGTQQLYVLKDTGAYEYWWNSTSGGIQHDTVMTLANPVDEYKEIEADGTQALFVADQNYPYEQRWGSGINGFQQTTFSSVSGITSISFSQDADAKHRYYIGSSSGAVWEASWYTGGGVGYWYMTGGPAVLSLQKWESDSTQVIYEATTGGVFEYSWPITSNTLSGRTIVGGLSSVHSFIRTTDPGNYQSVYTATGTNILESWWPQGSNTITTGQIE